MAAFAYNAINADGFELNGEVHAPTVEAAREQLRVRGLLADLLEELPSSGEESVRTAFRKVKPKSLQVFSRQFATMIDAGLNVVSALRILADQTDDKDLAAILDQVRAGLAVQIEKEANIKRRVKGAMIYPTMVACFAALVMTAMLLFLIPVFQKMYTQLGGHLPMLTQQIINASDLLRSRWYMIFPSIALLIWSFFRWKRSKHG